MGPAIQRLIRIHLSTYYATGRGRAVAGSSIRASAWCADGRSSGVVEVATAARMNAAHASSASFFFLRVRCLIVDAGHAILARLGAADMVEDRFDHVRVYPKLVVHQRVTCPAQIVQSPRDRLRFLAELRLAGIQDALVNFFL